MTSVLETQSQLSRLQVTLRALQEKLHRVNERIEQAREKHRQQIATSLRSECRGTRDAERIREWWEVPAISS